MMSEITQVEGGKRSLRSSQSCKPIKLGYAEQYILLEQV